VLHCAPVLRSKVNVTSSHRLCVRYHLCLFLIRETKCSTLPLEAGGGIPCRANPVTIPLVLGAVLLPLNVFLQKIYDYVERCMACYLRFKKTNFKFKFKSFLFLLLLVRLVICHCATCATTDSEVSTCGRIEICVSK